MTGREQTEIERKYDVEEPTQIPQFDGVDGVAEVTRHDPFTLTAVYYDTAENDLARRRIVLRRREGGGDEGWHLKTPADEGRTEVHWPLTTGDGDDSSAGPVPAAVLEPVRAIVRDRPLAPLARISTVRTTVHLHGADGEALAEVADDAVSASDARGGTYRKWREWEVELLDGAPDTRTKRTRLLDDIEAVVLAAGARPSSSVAKIARAVGADSLTDVPAPAVLPGLLPTPALQDPDSVAVIVVGSLRQLTGDLVRADPAARADAPDAIHRMRTIVRRLRSLLAVYGRLFTKPEVSDLRFELKQLGIELGRARDAEVRGRRVTDELAGVEPHPTGDAEIRLIGGARRDYADGLERARSYLLSSRYYRLLDALDSFADWPPLTEKAGKPAPAEISRDLTKAVTAISRAAARVSDADDPEAALHEVRKAARRLRYAADAVALAEPVVPVPPTATTVGKKAKKKARQKAKAKRTAAAARFATRRRRYSEIARAAKPLVKRLGERHDRLLYIEELEQAAQAAHEDGENTLLYGLLVARAEELEDTVAVVLADTENSVRRLERLVTKL
ncbi:CYTH and CHAD domain-containing protein [Cryobacterium sp. AP23]